MTRDFQISHSGSLEKMEHRRENLFNWEGGIQVFLDTQRLKDLLKDMHH